MENMEKETNDFGFFWKGTEVALTPEEEAEAQQWLIDEFVEYEAEQAELKARADSRRG